MIRSAANLFREFVGEGLMKNLLALLTVQFFRKVLPLLTIPYLARVLGPSSWGLLAIFQSLAMTLVLFIEFGFQLSATRQVARCRQSPERVGEVFAGVLGAQAVLAICAAFGVVLLGRFVPVMHEHPMLTALCLLWGIAEAINPTWFFLGMERMKVIAKLEISCKTAAALAIFALVHSSSDAGVALGLQSVAPLFALVFALAIVYKTIPFRLPTVRLIRAALTAGWPMFVLKSAESLYTLANAFLLGLFAGPLVVGYFAGPEKIARALFGLLNPVRETLYPRLSKLAHTDPREAARLARIGMIVTTLGGLLMGLLVFILAPFFVHVLLGDKFEPAVKVLRLLAILPPLTSVMQSVGIQWLLPLGRERVVTGTIVTAGLLNLLLVSLFVPRFAHIGMAWAVLCSEAFVCVSILYFALSDRTHPPPFFRSGTNPPEPEGLAEQDNESVETVLAR